MEAVLQIDDILLAELVDLLVLVLICLIAFDEADLLFVLVIELVVKLIPSSGNFYHTQEVLVAFIAAIVDVVEYAYLGLSEG